MPLNLFLYTKGGGLNHILEKVVARRTGLEPATSCVTGRHSNRLNYRRNVVVASGLEPLTSTL